MKKYAKDLLLCFKISIGIFLITFVIGTLIGVVISRSSYVEIIRWGCRMSEYIAIFGLATCALAFIKTDLLRPLDYQEEWEKHFYKMSLMFVILFVSIFMAIYSYTIEYFIYYIN